MVPSELDENDSSQTHASELPALTLTALDLQTLHAGISAEAESLQALDQLVLNTAHVLAGPRGAEARMRMLAKTLAIARAKVALMESMLDARLAQRDEQGVRLVARILDGARRNLVALLAEHRHACEAPRRTPVKVMVGQGSAVNVIAVDGGR